MDKRILLTAVTVLSFVTALGQASTDNGQPHKENETEPVTIDINEVVVTGTRNETDIRHLPMSISVVDRTQIEQHNSPSLLSVITEQVPGLFTTGRGIMGYGVSDGAAGQMSLRGVGGPAQAGVPTTGMLVLIDGHPQYMGLMGHPIADAYQSFLAERVEVVRGPASVLYGSNAMGGVINIVTRRMKQDGISTNANVGYGSYNSLQSEITNRIRKKGFTSVVSGSYNRTDGHRVNSAFEQYGGYAKLGYEFSQQWNIMADVNVTHFNASNPGAVDDPITDNDQRITRGMTSVALHNDYGKTSGALSFFYNWGRHRINDGYSAGEQPLDYRFNSRDVMTGVSLYQSVQLWKGNRLTAGMDYYHFGGEAWNLYVNGERQGERSDIADKSQDELAGYVDFRQEIGGWMTIDAGIRADHHWDIGTEWVPQAGISFHLPANSHIKLMASKGFRYPTIREMYMFPPQNPDLKPERLWSYEISFTQRLLDNRLSYGVNVFYINGDNLIMRIPVDGRQKNMNTGRIENAGVEVQAGYTINDMWRVDANYSFLHMEQPVLASPEHKLYAGGSFAKGRWNVSTGIQYVAGLYTSVVVAGTGEYRKESFVLWNAQCSFRATKWLGVWVRGENLLAQKYEINAGFPMPKATVMAGVNINI